MSDSTAAQTIARQAAARLAEDLNPQLPAEVAEILAGGQIKPTAERLTDWVSLAGLVVSIASLAWTIYHDLKHDHAGATAQSLTTALQQDPDIIARQPPTLPPAQFTLVLNVIASETISVSQQN